MKTKFDVVVVGAGPAGTTAAYILAKAGMDVVLFERGDYPGSKNVFGGVLYGNVLNDIIPNFWEKAPVERHITKHMITFLSQEASSSVDFKSTRFNQPPYNGFSVLRAKFDQWYAQIAEEAGVFVVPETVVDDLIWNEGKVSGVKTRRSEGHVYANVVIAADGVNSILAQKAGLRDEISPLDVSLSVKELIELPQKTIEERFNLSGNEGLAGHFIGSITQGVNGGAFLYTNKASISIGVVAHLASLARSRKTAYDILDDFKSHPSVRNLLKDGVEKEYGAHLIPEAGVNMMPKLYNGGLLVAGDAAGFTLAGGLSLEGANLAIASGAAAAETVKRAYKENDFSRAALKHYQELLEESFVLKDLRTFRSTPRFLMNPRIYTVYPNLVCDFMEQLFTVDGKPKKRILQLVRETIKGKVSLWQLLKDMARGARALR